MYYRGGVNILIATSMVPTEDLSAKRSLASAADEKFCGVLNVVLNVVGHIEDMESAQGTLILGCKVESDVRSARGTLLRVFHGAIDVPASVGNPDPCRSGDGSVVVRGDRGVARGRFRGILGRSLGDGEVFRGGMVAGSGRSGGGSGAMRW